MITDPTKRRTWLRAAGIETFSDIRSMDAEQLIDAFSSANGTVVTTRLVRNLVAQAWQQIQAGDAPPVQGNVRSFWYGWVKPVLLRVPPDRRRRERPDTVVSDTLASLIEGKRLMSYADFGFTDENWRNRVIGVLRPNVLVFAEKSAHLRLLLRLNKLFGVSVLTLGGMPSACTSEFTVRQLQEAMHRTKLGANGPVHLLGLVDHDPAGAIVAASFVRQLTSFGLRPTSVRLLVEPELLSAEQIAAHKYALKPGTGTNRWLDAGGGVDGEAFGLAVDAVPINELQRVATEAIKAVAPVPVEVAGDALPTDDPRWQEAVSGPGGLANVVVIGPNQLDAHVLRLVDEGKRVVVVEDGAVRAVL